MKNLTKSGLVGLLSMGIVGCITNATTDSKSGSPSNKTEQEIQHLLDEMTLEEKVGQMFQVTLDVVCKGDYHVKGKSMEIDPQRLDSALKIHHMGSILNAGSETLSPEKWHELINEIQRVAMEETRMKIPIIYGIDAIHGSTYSKGGTIFPQQLATAATWNPAHAENMGAVTAYEARASAIPWNFSPVLDLARRPLWSRVPETFGEDPYLATAMGDALVLGYQGEDYSNQYKVAACLKHYVGYSNSRSGKDRTPIEMTERTLREKYLPMFASAIKNGAATVMVNSADIDGTPVHANYHILTEILKDELGFDGFAVTDWADIEMLHTVHHVAKDHKEAVKLAINAGIDMSMTPYTFDFATDLIELVQEGEVPMSRINDAVRRILRVKKRLGLFEHPYYDLSEYPDFGSEKFRKLAYQSAAESITMLKNQDNILPLPKSARVLVTGVSADKMTALNGAWTHTWQGSDEDYDRSDKMTILKAIQTKIGAQQVVFHQGTDYTKELDAAAAIKAAKQVDYIIACIGELPSAEKPGDIHDLTLDQVQLDFVKQLAATGKPVILNIVTSRTRIVQQIEPLCEGILMAYRPGEEGGLALADILFGEVNPSGKLPLTYPKYSGNLVAYDAKFSEFRDPWSNVTDQEIQWPFGFGLSYTTFDYANLVLSSDTLGASQMLTVTVDVTNSGKRSGQETVILYTRDQFASISPEQRKVNGFQKIDLAPGETKTVVFEIAPEQLRFVNNNLNWVIEEGGFDVIFHRRQTVKSDDMLKASFYYKPDFLSKKPSV